MSFSLTIMRPLMMASLDEAYMDATASKWALTDIV